MRPGDMIRIRGLKVGSSSPWLWLVFLLKFGPADTLFSCTVGLERRFCLPGPSHNASSRAFGCLKPRPVSSERPAVPLTACFSPLLFLRALLPQWAALRPGGENPADGAGVAQQCVPFQCNWEGRSSPPVCSLLRLSIRPSHLFWGCTSRGIGGRAELREAMAASARPQNAWRAYQATWGYQLDLPAQARSCLACVRHTLQKLREAGLLRGKPSRTGAA